MPGAGSGLFDELKLGSIALSNRVAMAPMTRGKCGPTNTPDDEVAKYYRQRSSAGLIITEGAFTSEQAIGWVHAPGVYEPRHVEGWKKVTAAVHEEGGRIFCQLWHTGRATDASFRPNAQDGRGVGPSPIAMDGIVHTPNGKVQGVAPRELTVEEVAKLPEEYRNAAQCAKDAGFDGVEVHAANGYLFDSFLQTKTNKRTDKYGGSNENRFRVIAEILDAVCSVFPSTAVGIRFSPNGVFNDMGSKDFREIFTDYAKRLNAYNLAYLHVLDGLAFGFHELGEQMTLSEFRAVYDGKIMANCGYTKQEAEKALGAGLADIVSFGRPYITNPDLVERFKAGAELAPDADPKTWYSPVDTPSKNYTDYPPMTN